MDLQCGHAAENSPTEARIMDLRPQGSDHSCQGRRGSAPAWRKLGVGHCGRGTQRGSLQAPRSLAPVFSTRVPRAYPVLSRGQLAVCVAWPTSCSSVSLPRCELPPYSTLSTTSEIIASVVSIREATEAAFWRAVRVTLVGSMTPAFTRSSYPSVEALKPKFGSLLALIFPTTIAPSVPEFTTIWRTGSSQARRTILTPNCSSPSSLRASRTTEARNNATPPPGTIPSSTAARVACKASSTRAFFSFISTSVAAPTLINATPPASLATRSCNFSLS